VTDGKYTTSTTHRPSTVHKKTRGQRAFRSKKSIVNFQVHSRQSLLQMYCWCSETLRDFSPVRLFYI